MKGRIINVILSGGAGTRLWPLSRESKPKQFIQMFDGLSLFQHTVNRNINLVDDFLLVTNTLQLAQAKSQIKEINANISNILIEPIGRNTAPAIALACLKLRENDILIVTPADHMVEGFELYENAIDRAIEMAKHEVLVTFGIKPTNPNIGFGYIESKGENVVSFREKPDLETAKKFLEKGNFNWNSGIFCFQVKTFLDQLKKYNKPMFDACVNASKSINKEGEINKELMLKIPSDSIDYAILEKSDRIKTISGEFYWTDLGTYDSIIDYFEEGNNVDILRKNTSYCFSQSKKKLLTNIEDLILVEEKDYLIILERGKSNDIKNIHKKHLNSENIRQ